MIKIINYMVWVIVAIILTVSCATDSDMQNYFIKHQDDANFLAIDIPASVLGIANTNNMTPDAKEAVNSFKKLNVLAFKKNKNNQAIFEKEKKTIKKILSNKTYKDLMRFKDGKNMVIIKYLGTDKSVNQFIVFGYSNSKGFALVRILGDKMDANKALKLIMMARSGKIDSDKFNDIKKIFN